MLFPVLLALISGLPGGLEIGFGPVAASLDPSDGFYRERFLTPGLSIGGEAVLTSRGPVGFLLGGGYFHKQGSRGWDGEVRAFTVWAFPVASATPFPGLAVFAGPGVTGCWGDYSGTDDFGGFMEASGGSVGYGFTAGGEVLVWGPLSARMQYRSVWMDMKTSQVTLDGSPSFVYPPEETDLGFSGWFLGLSVSLAGGGNSVWR